MKKNLFLVFFLLPMFSPAVQGVDQLYEFVKKNGWNQVSEVITQPWVGRTCYVTTIDGSVLGFFE